MQLSFEVFDEYLKIHLSSENPFAEINEILLAIKKLSEENNRTRIIIDASSVPAMSDMQRFYVGNLGINVFGNEIKIALVSKPEYINKFMENVAVNRGGQLCVVGSEQEALRWLLA